MSPCTRVLAAGLAVLAALLASGVAASATGGDPKVALTSGDQAAAKEIVLRRGDLGSGWALTKVHLGGRSIAAGSLCPGFHPDLSRLTVTGQAATRATNTVKSAVTVALVLKRRADAQAIARELQAPFVRRCFQPGTTRNDVRVDTVSRDSLAGGVRYRIGMTFVKVHKRYYADYVYLTNGRRWVSVIFSSVGLKLPESVEPRAIQALQQRLS